MTFLFNLVKGIKVIQSHNVSGYGSYYLLEVMDSSLLQEMDLDILTPILMHCDNYTLIVFANNSAFQAHTKCTEADYHYIRDLLMRKQIVTSYIRLDDQLEDILMKPLPRNTFQCLCSRLSIAQGGVLKFIIETIGFIIAYSTLEIL